MKINDDTEKQYGVQSVRKAFAILEAFSIEEPQLTVAEICKRVLLPRPTVTRLLTTLAEGDYIVKDQNSRKYSLGVKFCRLGTVAKGSWELKKVSFPVLKDLNRNYKETTYIDLVDGWERLCILSVEGTQPVRTVVPVGQRAPLYAGSDGRILLAFQPESTIDQIINKCMTTYKSRFAPDFTQLKQLLGRVKEEGVSISFGEWVKGSVGISAPIRDETGEVVAGVSMSVPDYRATEALLATYKVAIQKAALCISTALGYCERNGGDGRYSKAKTV